MSASVQNRGKLTYITFKRDEYDEKLAALENKNKQLIKIGSDLKERIKNYFRIENNFEKDIKELKEKNMIAENTINSKTKEIIMLQIDLAEARSKIAEPTSSAKQTCQW